MEYVMKKTYLGLALDEVLEDLGLETMQREIGDHFKAAFMKNYSALVKNSDPIEISGIEENLKESPIGNGDKYSCFTVIASKIKYRGMIEFLNQKATTSTCIEAFSDNKKKVNKVPKLTTKRTVKGTALPNKTH